MSTSQNGLWTMGKGEFEQSIRDIETAIMQRGGNPVQIFNRIREDKDFTGRIAEFILRGAIAGIVHYKFARDIMGDKNFWGVEDWSSFFGLNFSKKQLQEIVEFPWGEDILNAPCPFRAPLSIRQTHFAFLGLESYKGKPLTTVKWDEILSPDGLRHMNDKPQFYPDAPNKFGEETKRAANKLACKPRWYLMFLGNNYMSKAYAEQVAMLPAEYEIPFVIEEVTKNILYYKKNGDYPTLGEHARCRDMGLEGHISVGLCNGSSGRGISLGTWDDGPAQNVTLTASRKLPTLN